MIQILILAAFWLSYLAITFASVIIIADFVDRVQKSREAKKPVKPVTEQESVKLHISEGLIEVNRLPGEQDKP